MIPDLSDPIVPGRSAAGILVGSPVDELLARSQPLQTERRSEYVLHEFPSVRVWSLGGVITQIGVFEGYRGTLEQKIGIGSSIAEVEDWCGCKVVEDEEDNLIAEGRPGWCFETTVWVGNHRVENNRDATITEIFVYHPQE